MNEPTPFQSHSQAGQDIFAYEMTERKLGGSFLDIGCNDAKFHSNSYALEEFCSWRGLCVDIESGCESRKSTFVKCDAAHPDDRLKFHYRQLPDVTDFLSLDADSATLGAFNALPWDRLTFRVVCLEHDAYRIGPDLRDKLRSMLGAMGYFLCCADVKVRYPAIEPPKSFEDWFIEPALTNPELVKKYQCSEKMWNEIVTPP